MCIDEDDVSKQEPPRPSDTGHADYEATDFLDTLPMLQDEIESSPVPARALTRDPIERAMARHESASVALPATIGAKRDDVPQRPRSSQPASPARLRIDSAAKADAAQKGRPRPAAQPSHTRDARIVPPSIAVSTKANDGRRLREDWAVSRMKAHVATLSPSVPRSDDSTLSSTWIAESRQPSSRTSSRQGMRRGAGAALPLRASLLAISVGAVTTALFGAIVYIARPGAQTPGTSRSAAAPLQRPEAVAPAQQADAAPVSEVDSDGDGAGPSTKAPDARMASVRRTSAVPSRMKNMREAARETAAEPPSQLRPPARGAAPSNSVASAVEAAQAKADAFLRNDAQEPPEQKPAKPSMSALPREPGRS